MLGHIGIDAQVVQAGAERFPQSVVELLAEEFLTRRLCLVQVLLAGHRRTGDADYARIGRHLAGRVPAIQGGQQFAGDEITRATEQQHIETGKYCH